MAENAKPPQIRSNATALVFHEREGSGRRHHEHIREHRSPTRSHKGTLLVLRRKGHGGEHGKPQPQDVQEKRLHQDFILRCQRGQDADGLPLTR